MSVTVADLMKLPCLREAKVLAGHRGLGRIVTSISVLEYARPGNLLDDLYASNEFNGGEIVITGFISIKDDVEAQCLNIRQMAAVGEVGLILYYVGVLLPAVDPRLIELCDQLDFTLICMPEGRVNLRYSEVICEVMEAVFKDQQSDPQLVSAILDRVALLPEHQRSVDTVLKMLSDRVRASVVLTDIGRHVLNAAAWPRTLGDDLERTLWALPDLPEPGGPPLELQDPQVRLYRCGIDAPTAMELFLFKEGEALPAEIVRQAGEVVRLAVNIWSQRHAQVVMSELVRAILKDEPLKMRRLADIFHIDVASIQTMWVIRGEAEQRALFRQKAPELVRELLAHHCATVVADFYEGDLVAFMDWSQGAGAGDSLADALWEQLAGAGLEARLVLCHGLPDTAAVRRAYLTILDGLKDARLIWPGRRWYTLQETQFARTCRETVDRGEADVQKALAVLAPIRAEREGAELTRTLQVYLLDTGSSAAGTAEVLFLHKNTVKYRLRRMADALGHSVGRMPESFDLYTACALERLLTPEL